AVIPVGNSLFISSHPVLASHSRSILSSPPVTMRDPSAENAAERMAWVWPRNVASALPEVASQVRATPSLAAVRSRWPSGLKVAVYMGPWWPSIATSSRPVAESTARAVPDNSRPLPGPAPFFSSSPQQLLEVVALAQRVVGVGPRRTTCHFR